MMQNFSLDTVWTGSRVVQTLSRNIFVIRSMSDSGYAFFNNIVLSVMISLWTNSHVELIVYARKSSVKMRFRLYSSGIKLPKFVNTPLNVGFRYTEVIKL
jgi:hypothetical protein